jgi:hypothetical protein
MIPESNSQTGAPMESANPKNKLADTEEALAALDALSFFEDVEDGDPEKELEGGCCSCS